MDYEHIIIDDASTDNTKEFLEELALRDRKVVPVISPVNKRTAHALNLGFSHATGDFILPLDDDDLLLPYSLKLHADFLQDNPQVQLSFGHAVLIDESSRLKLWNPRLDFNKVTYSDNNEEFYAMMLECDRIVNGSAIIARKAVDDVGGWDENFNCQDWEMYLKLIYQRKVHKWNPAYLSCYRIHEKQLTTTQSIDGTWSQEAVQLRKMYGTRK